LLKQNIKIWQKTKNDYNKLKQNIKSPKKTIDKMDDIEHKKIINTPIVQLLMEENWIEKVQKHFIQEINRYRAIENQKEQESQSKYKITIDPVQLNQKLTDIATKYAEYQINHPEIREHNSPDYE